ncbi:EamA family transporter RarD [Candidatus Pelagibacter bacterium]|nr:EamA family transporter RarD [Candidatus Pelagibacter bacterium]
MNKSKLSGVFYACFASLWWGVIGTIFFKFVSFASFIELTVHRTIWTAVLLVLSTSLLRKWPEFIKIIKKRKNQFLLFLSGLLVSINWGTWLYAVSVNRLLDSSLGYYIYPIISVFLGKIFLKEKLNKNQFIAVILVVISLIYFLLKLGELPWIGLTVAITFSIYGLIRKKIRVSSDIGLLIETLLISPIAIVLFVYLVNMKMNIFSTAEPILSFYLFWSGFITLVPLFLYTLGFKIIGIGPASMILFLTPTSQFLLGITYFGEILTLEKFLGFLIIWVAVSIYLNELRKE